MDVCVLNEVDRDKTKNPPKLARARGALRISVKRRDSQTVLDDFYQQGCLKARFPAVETGHIREGVVINTSGGLTDGDRLDQEFIWGENTVARMTGQAAERIYRSRLGDAIISTSLTIGAQAHAQYLPQENHLV